MVLQRHALGSAGDGGQRVAMHELIDWFAGIRYFAVSLFSLEGE